MSSLCDAEGKMPLVQIHVIAITHCACTAGDSVFLSNEKERQEYVMKEDGTIFTGSWNHIEAVDWDFGQVNTYRFLQSSQYKAYGFLNPT